MKRSELKTKYLQSLTLENFNKFRKQKIFCSRLYKKERKKFFDKLDIKLVTENKKFWATIKPFLGHKILKLLLLKAMKYYQSIRILLTNLINFTKMQ